ncbi:MAG: response regulator transcription factor [Firmicutes bacterium]|nr:response regulator transcription factor [Bacillota bacterium]
MDGTSDGSRGRVIFMRVGSLPDGLEVEFQIAENHPVYQVGGSSRPLLVISPETGEVWLGTERLNVTAAELRILAKLAENGRRITTPEVLYDALYGDGTGGEGSGFDVRSHIRNLRRKLGDDGRDPYYILNHRSLGYQLRPGTYRLIKAETDGYG